jgi:hypothetical protein
VVVQAFHNPVVTQAISADEVEATFGPNGAHKKSQYALSFILPANFDSSLKAGNHTALTMYLDGNTVNAQSEVLLQTAIIDYACTLANPQPPVIVNTMVINPPSSTNTGALLGQLDTPLVQLLSLAVGPSFIP